MTTPEDKEMFQRLSGDASIGADLSPGDPVCAWAVSEIKKLRAENAKLQTEGATLRLTNQKLKMANGKLRGERLRNTSVPTRKRGCCPPKRGGPKRGCNSCKPKTDGKT